MEFTVTCSNVSGHELIWHSCAFRAMHSHRHPHPPITTVPHTSIRSQKSVISDPYIQFLTSLYLSFKSCGSRIKSGYPIRSFIASSFWTANSLVSLSIHSVLVSNSWKLCIISSVIWTVWKEYQHIVDILVGLVWLQKLQNEGSFCACKPYKLFFNEKNKWYLLTTNIQLIWYRILTSFLLYSSKYFCTNMAPTAMPKWLFTSMIQFFQRGGDSSLPNKT